MFSLLWRSPSTDPSHSSCSLGQAESSSCPCGGSLLCQLPIPTHLIPLDSLKHSFAKELAEKGKEMPVERWSPEHRATLLGQRLTSAWATTALPASPHGEQGAPKT